MYINFEITVIEAHSGKLLWFCDNEEGVSKQIFLLFQYKGHK